MRTKIVLYVILSIGSSMSISYAQGDLRIVYENTRHIEPAEDLPIDNNRPTKSVSMYALAFDGIASSYTKDTDYEDPNMDERRRRWNRGNEPHVVYYDFDKGSALEQISFFRKNFLVEDTIADLKWKVVASEQRDILGYTAMKAILADTTQLVEAWFAPQIPAAVGPESYYGLPGAILAVTIDEQRVILAKSVEQNADAQVVRPTDGKSMTRLDFEILKEEKTAEMKKNWNNSSRRWRGR